MRILVCHNSYQQPGGEDRSVAAEAALLRAHGHDVIEYSRHNDEIKDYRLLKKALLYFVTTWSRKSYREVKELCRKHRPDIAHFHNTLPLISPSAYYACKQEGVPVVQALRNYRLICPSGLLMRSGEICEDCIGGDFTPSLKHKCYRDSYIQTRAVVHMLRKHWKRGTYSQIVDMYIALTNFARDKFIEGGLPAEKIAVKPNFMLDPPQPCIGGDYAVFAGRISFGKGVHVLLKAWRQLDFPLTVIGDGPQRRKLEEMRIPGVNFLGYLPHGDAIELLRRARFLVFPALLYETFGRAMIEAFACGKPVIASRLGTATEIVEDGKTGLLFEPGDAEDLAAKAKTLIDNSSLAEELGRNAREEFEAKYTPERNHRELVNIYLAAIRGSST